MIGLNDTKLNSTSKQFHNHQQLLQSPLDIDSLHLKPNQLNKFRRKTRTENVAWLSGDKINLGRPQKSDLERMMRSTLLKPFRGRDH